MSHQKIRLKEKNLTSRFSGGHNADKSVVPAFPCATQISSRKHLFGNIFRQFLFRKSPYIYQLKFHKILPSLIFISFDHWRSHSAMACGKTFHLIIGDVRSLQRSWYAAYAPGLNTIEVYARVYNILQK